MAFDYTVLKDPFSFKNITNTSTTAALVKTGAGVLHAVVVNTTAAGTVPIYDNTAGSGTLVGTLKASIAITLPFNSENSTAFLGTISPIFKPIKVRRK